MPITGILWQGVWPIMVRPWQRVRELYVSVYVSVYLPVSVSAP